MSNYKEEERRVIRAIRACKTEEQLDYASAMRIELICRHRLCLVDFMAGRDNKAFTAWHEQRRKIARSMIERQA